ncbi:MAG: hypothetical protein HXX09_12045 [Bacteroidetes bacterium]|nr:hypothetical protein [Bacteroidota bacterium]
MQYFEVKNTNDFGIFRKVIQGCFYSKNLSKSFEYYPFNLLKHANSGVFHSAATKEEAIKNINKEDFLLEGFRDLNDFLISYEYNSNREIYEAIATPLIIYKLNENLGVPFPLNPETRTYLEFIADQLERVKIRAQQDLYRASTPERATRLISIKLQVLDNLFHDSKSAFYYCCSRPITHINETELYFLFVLNLCIIRSIVIYSKSFKAFITNKPPNENAMRISLLNEIPCISKYPWLLESDLATKVK